MQEKNGMNVFNVEKPLCILLVFVVTKNFVLERNPMAVLDTEMNEWHCE